MRSPNMIAEFATNLIRGVLVVTPIPSEGEAAPNDELGAMPAVPREHPQGPALMRHSPAVVLHLDRTPSS